MSSPSDQAGPSAGSPQASDAVRNTAASRRLARQDRGFTSEEGARLQPLAARTGGVGDPGLLQRRQPRRPWRRRVAAAAALVALGFIIGWSRRQASTRPGPAEPALAIVRRLALSDGSIVELGPQGRVEESFTPAERRIRLLAGRANFRVAKNFLRPFVVSARDVDLRAVGAVFEVRLEGDSIAVVVTEGKVQAQRATRREGNNRLTTIATESVFVAAGHRAVLPTGGEDAILVDDKAIRPLANAGADERLVFSAQPLAEVAAAFNRYNRRQLFVANPATGALRIGGSFRAHNLDAFLHLIKASLGVTAETRSDGNLVLRRSD